MVRSGMRIVRWSRATLCKQKESKKEKKAGRSKRARKNDLCTHLDYSCREFDMEKAEESERKYTSQKSEKRWNRMN